MWPSEEVAFRLYDFANWGLIAGLVVGVISTVLLVWMGNVKETYLRRDLATTTAGTAAAIERAGNAGKEAAEANKKAAEANEGATKAQASLALAEKQAAEANAKAEGLRLDIAKAQQEAASANEIAERERLARMQLEAQLADRVLTPNAQAQLTALARALPNGKLDICSIGGTLEITNIAKSIGDALSAGGWTVRTWQLMGGASARGVLIGTSPTATDEDRGAASQIALVLNSSGIGGGIWQYAELAKAANSGMRSGPPGAVDAPILMVIGSKR